MPAFLLQSRLGIKAAEAALFLVLVAVSRKGKVPRLLVTVVVSYSAQGQEFSVPLSTVVEQVEDDEEDEEA